MRRQFDFLNRDFELIKEKCFLLTEINNMICDKKLTTPNPLKEMPKLTQFDFEDKIEENVNKLNSDKNLETSTPLLDSLMKKKRIREYKEKTLMIQSAAKKSNSKAEF